MSENTKETTEKGIENVEVALTKAEQFIENNQKILTIAVIVVVGLIAIFILSKKYYFAPREEEAKTQMFVAERYFEKDSFKLALNGDGSFVGFAQIIDDYKFTKSGNLARYYAGISCLRTAQYQKAIDYLDKFSSDDTYIGTIAIGATGDSYSQLGNKEEALKYYLKATKKNPNQFVTPIYLMKAAEVCESKADFKQALELYERVEAEFPSSTEGRSVAKYIARAKEQIN